MNTFFNLKDGDKISTPLTLHRKEENWKTF